MKKVFIILITIPVLFASCRKDDIAPEEKKSDTVRFNVSASTSADEPSVSGSALKDVVSQFTLVGYDQAGEEVFRQTQLASSPDFGMLSIDVPRGTYRAVAIASASRFNINSIFLSGPPVTRPYSNAYMGYLQDEAPLADRYYKTSDTFYASVLYTVSEDVALDIVLQRVVGKLDVVVKDLDEFRVNVLNEATGYSFSSEAPIGMVTSSEWPYKTGTRDQPASFYIIQTGTPLKIEIVGGGRKIGMSVPVHKNQRTFVSGTMNEIAKPAKLSVAVVTTWDADSILHTF